MSSIIRYQPFEPVSGNLEGIVPVVEDVLSTHEQQIYPNACIEFEFRADRNNNVDLSRQT